MNAPPSRRERFVLNQWTAMRERGFRSVLPRMTGLLIFWSVFFLPGIVTPGSHRPYFIGGLIGFLAHNLMTLRASHAFWPTMKRFIDWEKVDARVTEYR